MFKNLLEKPFKLLSLIGLVYIFITTVLKITTGFPFSPSVFPKSDLITYFSLGISFVLCLITYFLFTKHVLYYLALELLVFSNIYSGEIYVALFLSSILLILLLSENRKITALVIIIYALIEIAKLCLVIPFGVTVFFYYTGLSLFALCSIGCVNLLFHHAYSKKETDILDLNELKLSDRQKDCIKEIVLNNTTIKALALTYNVSESAIKKDLAHIYKVLEITGKADLKALFIGYKF